MTTHAESTSHSKTRSRAGSAPHSKTSIRDRVRDAAADAFRGKNLTFRHLHQVVGEMLTEVADQVRSAVPDDRRNALRQTLEGLDDAITSAAAAGKKAVRDTREHASKLITEDAPAAAHRIREANDQFLDAVGSFASRSAEEIRDDLGDLVRHARRAGPRVMEGMESAFKVANEGRVVELAGETAKAGARFARKAAHDLAMAAGGLMEGLADAITPPKRKAGPSASTPSRSKTAAARTSKTVRSAKSSPKVTKKASASRGKKTAGPKSRAASTTKKKARSRSR